MVPIDSSIKNYPEDKLFSTVLYGSEDFNNDRIKKNQINHFKYLVRSDRFNRPLFKLSFYDETGTFFAGFLGQPQHANDFSYSSLLLCLQYA